MKLKNKYIGCIFYNNGNKILLSDVMDERLFRALQVEHPHLFEEVKKKKSKKAD